MFVWHAVGYSEMTGEQSENIRDDVFCIRCDYNLKTLERSNRCPECGLPIAKSLAESSHFSLLEKTIAICVPPVGIAPLLCIPFGHLGGTEITNILVCSILVNVGLGIVILRLRSLRIGWRIRRKLLLIVVPAAGFAILHELTRRAVVMMADV